MKAVLGIAALLAGSLAAAEEAWTPMTGPEIEAALSGVTLIYENGWQAFRADGRTLYHVGSDSWGSWRVTGDQYCSEWPPAGGWDCYDMARSADGTEVRFIWPADGSTTDGRITR